MSDAKLFYCLCFWGRHSRASSPYALLYLNRFIHIKYAAIYLSAIALMTYITIVITTKLLDNSENLVAVNNES